MALFEFQGIAVFIRGGDVIEEERVVEFFWVRGTESGSCDRFRASCADKLRLDRFGYVDGGIAMDDDLFIEAPDDDLGAPRMRPTTRQGARGHKLRASAAEFACCV